MMSEVEQPLKERQRGPGFPTVDLEKAIEKVATIYEADHGLPATLDALAAHWETSPKSSGFLQLLASLKRFGLLSEVEGSAQRQLKPTKQAIDILLLPKDDPRRISAIKSAALLPKIHQDLWQSHKVSGIPSDTTLIHHLVQELGFRHDSAKDLVDEYKTSISFAGLTKDDKIVPEPSQDDQDDGDNRLENSELEKMTAIANKPSEVIRMMIEGERATPKTITTPVQKMRDFKIPLVDSPDAVLFVPTRLTEENFDLLKAMLGMFLDTAKKALIKDGNKETEKENS
jgi:hypothetical protein